MATTVIHRPSDRAPIIARAFVGAGEGVARDIPHVTASRGFTTRRRVLFSPRTGVSVCLRGRAVPGDEELSAELEFPWTSTVLADRAMSRSRRLFSFDADSCSVATARAVKR